MQLETRESWEKHSQHCWGDIRTKLSLWLREKKRKQSKYKEQMITQFCSIRLLIPRQMIRCDLEGPGLISSNKLSDILYGQRTEDETMYRDSLRSGKETGWLYRCVCTYAYMLQWNGCRFRRVKIR